MASIFKLLKELCPDMSISSSKKNEMTVFDSAKRQLESGPLFFLHAQTFSFFCFLRHVSGERGVTGIGHDEFSIAQSRWYQSNVSSWYCFPNTSIANQSRICQTKAIDAVEMETRESMSSGPPMNMRNA